MFVNNLAEAFQANPLYAIAAAFLAGLITSLGPCTFARSLVLLGHVAKEKDVDYTKGFFISFIFLIGLTIAYGLFGVFGFLTTNINIISNNIYYIVGIVAIIMGLHFAGIIDIKLPTSSDRFRGFRNLYNRYRGPGGGFIMGFTFGLLLCPCCIPGLLFIISFTFIKGNFLFGIVLLFIYVIGHGIPLLIVGTFSGAITGLKRIQKYSTYVNLIVGTLIFLAGLLFLWIV